MKNRTTEEEMAAATTELVEKGGAVRSAAKAHGIAKSYLAGIILKFKNAQAYKYQ